MSMEFAENKASNNIIDAYIRAYKNFFNFKGRTSRYDYWGFHLINFFVVILLYILSAYLAPNSESSAKNVLIFLNIYQFVILIPSFSAWVRRFHDTNKSALKWVLLPLVVCFAFFVFAGSSLDKTLFIIIGALLFTVMAITWFVITCCRGSAADNKYGPAIMEDSSQRWKGLSIPILMVTLPFLLAFSLGIVGGYWRATNRYQAEKIVPVIYSLLSEAKGENGAQPIVEDDFSWHDKAQLTGMFFTDPFGVKIEIKLSKGEYVITRSDVSFSLCMALSEYNWTENPDFVKMRINGGKDCLSCKDAQTCKIEWIYK
ncbi:MAG: DUF805 domain-containing protein [Alphaproteobacteria bacterium]|nr:DUF805 domain-containing protein [Alphaproteobacteria bacterium]